jgi:hypothetical protein
MKQIQITYHETIPEEELALCMERMVEGIRDGVGINNRVYISYHGGYRKRIKEIDKIKVIQKEVYEEDQV